MKVENNPLIYWDPSGNIISGDKNLTKKEQDLIVEYTKEFLKAEKVHDSKLLMLQKTAVWKIRSHSNTKGG